MSSKGVNLLIFIYMAVQISTRTNFTSVMGTNTHMKLKNGVNMTLKMSVYRQGISKILKNARR